MAQSSYRIEGPTSCVGCCKHVYFSPNHSYNPNEAYNTYDSVAARRGIDPNTYFWPCLDWAFETVEEAINARREGLRPSLTQVPNVRY